MPVNPFILNKMLKERILNLLWPKICFGCGRTGFYICPECDVFLSEAMNNDCQKMITVWQYEGIMEKAIKKSKEGCFDIISELTEKALLKIDFCLPEDSIITYVPMHPNKERRRGFNQAKIIAQKIGEKTGKPVSPLLRKIKDNKEQESLNKMQERLENVKGVFEAVKTKNQSVLLVDDVYLTGATMQECVRVLNEAGANDIYGFALARKL